MDKMFDNTIKMLLVILIVCTMGEFATAHKTGAPAFSCSTMTPGHGASPQTTPAPYNLTVLNTSQYGIDEGPIRLKLTANKYFTGFLLRAKLTPFENPSNSASAPLSGTFVEVPSDSHILDCLSERASAVTHTTNTKKRSVEVDWKTPAGFEGLVVFVATIVQDYSTFWVGVESSPIQIGRRAARNSFSNNNYQDDQLNAALLSVYDGCGTTKNCLGFPDNCLRSKSCNGLAAVMNDDGIYQVEMFAKQAKYVAIGFSDDALMGGDNVAECVQEGNNVRSYRSYNEPNRKSNRRLEDDTGVTLVRGMYADGAIFCKLRVEAVTFAADRRFDLNNQQYFLLLAAGSGLSDRGPGVGFHNLLYTSSKIPYRLSEVTSAPSRDSFYDGCNTVKTCFGVPEGCVDRQNCQAVTTVTAEGSRFLFSMLTRGAAFIATGLSKDLYMGEDIVIECVVNEVGNIEAYQSWNVPNRKDNTRVGKDGVELLSGSSNNGYLQCAVAFDPRAASLNLNQKYYLLLAAGTAVHPDKVGYHNLLYKASSQQVTVPSALTKSDSFYYGCDRTKGCFGSPNDCVRTQNCRIALATSTDFNNRYVFQLMADRNAQYVAVGLSDDSQMGDDVVFECVRDPQTNDIRAHMSWNLPGQKKNTRLSENYLSLVNKSFVDGTMQCTVLLQNSVFSVNRKNFNLVTDKYILLLAAGSKASAASPGNLGQVGYHDLGRIAAAERRALADVSVVKGASKLLLYLHGSFMIAAWIGLASLGIVFARYYRQTWTGGSCCGKDVWFFWHRSLMFLTWVLTIAGVIIILIYSGGLITGTPGETHMLLGFLTTLLTFLQPIGALFRPSPSSSRRPIFNWLHWLIGNAAHIAAIVTIFLAVDLSKAELPKWTDYILVGFVAYYVFIHLLLSVLGCLSDKSGGIRIENIQMKDINSGRGMPPTFEREKDAAYSGARKFFLSFHFLVVVAFSLALILLVIEAPSIR